MSDHVPSSFQGLISKVTFSSLSAFAFAVRFLNLRLMNSDGEAGSFSSAGLESSC
jgi:hypothetical protein